jgi:hypothetical protein
LPEAFEYRMRALFRPVWFTQDMALKAGRDLMSKIGFGTLWNEMSYVLPFFTAEKNTGSVRRFHDQKIDPNNQTIL